MASAIRKDVLMPTPHSIYQQQYGGIACRQGQVEGFLVPVFGPKGLSQISVDDHVIT